MNQTYQPIIMIFETPKKIIKKIKKNEKKIDKLKEANKKMAKMIISNKGLQPTQEPAAPEPATPQPVTQPPPQTIPQQPQPNQPMEVIILLKDGQQITMHITMNELDQLVQTINKAIKENQLMQIDNHIINPNYVILIRY